MTKVLIEVDATILEKLTVRAKQDKRSRKNYIEKILDDFVKGL